MNRTTRSTLAATTLAVLALGLTACGDDDAEPTSGSPITIQPEAGTNQAGPADLETAAATALGAVDGTLVSIDLDDDGTWDVDVVASDGSETSVRVSADGSEVTDQRPDDQDGDDLAENQRLLTATVDWEAALDAAAADLTGPATEASLDEDDGRLTWEVGTGDDTVTVLVDAASGDVLGTEQD